MRTPQERNLNPTFVPLTSPRGGDITPARKKGGLNISYT
jgi:hypothetical protein